MRPSIKSIHSPDLDPGREPDDPDDCHILVEVEIGPEGIDGADVFSFEVITPTRIAGQGPRWGRGLLILDSVSWHAIETALTKLLKHCSGDDWNEISAELNKELHWEFENYQERS